MNSADEVSLERQATVVVTSSSALETSGRPWETTAQGDPKMW